LSTGLLCLLALLTGAALLAISRSRPAAVLPPLRKHVLASLRLTLASVVVLLMANIGVIRSHAEVTGVAPSRPHQIHLTWAAPVSSSKPILGYNIYRSSDGGKTFSKRNSSPVVKPDYTDTGVKSGRTYLYVVRSVDGTGAESGPSNQIRLTVPK